MQNEDHSHRYDVHVFAVIRRKISGISAATPTEAIRQTLAGPVVRRWLESFTDADESGEFAEEISHYLVDVVGDEEFAQSRWFQSADDPLLAPLRDLIRWDESGRDPAALTSLLTTMRGLLADTV